MGEMQTAAELLAEFAARPKPAPAGKFSTVILARKAGSLDAKSVLPKPWPSR